MRWIDLISAVGLLMVIEGILPFLSPDKMRAYSKAISDMPDHILRTMGALLMLAGILVIYLV